MPDQRNILLEIPEALIKDLTHSIQSKGKYATGKTVEALEATGTDHSAQLVAPKYINVLEDGRKPTRPDAPKGNPTLQQAIAEWCVAKGIDEKLSWPIAKHIHKFGFPGTPGVISEPLGDDNVNKRVNEVAGKLATLLTTKFADSLHI